MKKLAIAIAVAISGMFAAGAAHAASFQNSVGLAGPAYVETFDSPAVGNYSPADNLFSSMTFSDNLYVTTDYNGFLGFSGQSIVNRSSSSCCSTPSYVDFANVIEGVGFRFMTNPGTSTFSAYLNNALVESFSASTDLAANQYYGFTGISFDRIRFDSGGFNGASFLDDMQFAAAPVPEPEIYAMMAAGLGLVGFVARRRKQQIAAA